MCMGIIAVYWVRGVYRVIWVYWVIDVYGVIGVYGGNRGMQNVTGEVLRWYICENHLCGVNSRGSTHKFSGWSSTNTLLQVQSNQREIPQIISRTHALMNYLPYHFNSLHVWCVGFVPHFGMMLHNVIGAVRGRSVYTTFMGAVRGRSVYTTFMGRSEGDRYTLPSCQGRSEGDRYTLPSCRGGQREIGIHYLHGAVRGRSVDTTFMSEGM
jgi:hypothetical protein